MHSDGVHRIVNPESYEEARQEQVSRCPSGSDYAGRPRSKEVAAGTDGDHPCYGAVDGADEGVGAGDDLVDEETNYSCSAACHLRRWLRMIAQDLITCVLTTALENASPSPALLMEP